MCTLTSTLATYRLGQDTRVRRVLQAKVADNLASRGVSTADIWHIRTPNKLTPAEKERLERQRLNKRNWARKERERSKKKLEDLKTVNCQLEYTNRRLRSDVDKLRRGHFQLKSALKDHDCHKLQQMLSSQLLLSGLLPVVTSSHQPQELAVGVGPDLGQRFLVVCSEPCGEDGDASEAATPGVLRRRVRSESAAGPLLVVDSALLQKQFRKGVSWPAEQVTYVVLEGDPSSGTSAREEEFNSVAMVTTEPQVAAEEDVADTAADDESVTSGGFAVQTDDGDVGEFAEVSGGGFLRMLNEDDTQVVLSVEVPTEQSAADGCSDNERVLFIQELQTLAPKIDTMNALHKGDSNTGSIILEVDVSQQVSSTGENCEEVVRTPCEQLVESPEKGSNSGNLQRRGLVMDPWCVSADASNSSTLCLSKNRITKGAELSSHQPPPRKRRSTFSPGCCSLTEADDQQPKPAPIRVRFSQDGVTGEASPAKRPRFSLQESVALSERSVAEEAALATGVSEQTTVVMDHLYYETSKNSSRSAESDLHTGTAVVLTGCDATFRPVAKLILPEDIPPSPSTPSSTGSTAPVFASSECAAPVSEGDENTQAATSESR